MSTGNRKILLDSTHFSEIRSIIRSRSVAWDALARASELSELDASVAKRLENLLVRGSASDEELAQLKVDANVVEPLIHLLGNSSNNDSIKSAQNLVSELLSCQRATVSDDTVEYFRDHPEQLVELYAVSFKPNDDLQTVLISSFNIVSLLIQRGLTNDKLVEQFLNNEKFLRILTNTKQMDTCYVCIRLLQELCTVQSYKSLVWANESQVLPTVFEIIGSNRSSGTNGGATNAVLMNTNSNNLGIQLQYYSLLLVWLLTFNCDIASELESKHLKELLGLLRLVKITIKEKISRVCIGILLQCCSSHVRGHKTFIKELILLGNGIATLDSLSERKYSDQELRQDIASLREILEAEYKELTSFDEYLAEINSRLISWTPPHVDSSFWVDNIDRFKQDNWKLFKRLISLLIEAQTTATTTTDDDTANERDGKKTRDRLVIQVLLNDITHVIELLPDESVDVLNKMNGKVVIMQLLNHSDSRVKYEALKATQSIIGYTFK
ncbi:H(+)-transporting V1 sector ATPase subunit H KNAG_0B02090 [Huiozyma naganishii CBS 8797]|uniref:V-type proton ATPase subunit H n=1 Tax=Huiozyma naganishii (strain ATCC MYA-139 / BCRC 22969 / CBS 8797 / KCTC 17520 / NBRC 10181 / NCYC 3082 / Yp74L-3) TaxID=1071383 RepID=J7S4L6_HUIN7|nr:hypothetical protein KNAG_0B02090 [Kazachstania naganishii CBS 8797]CCK68651.1 hypothetical protein KNAG_0B02090 [Kazachstania naganishii CBS 8797]